MRDLAIEHGLSLNLRCLCLSSPCWTAGTHASHHQGLKQIFTSVPQVCSMLVGGLGDTCYRFVMDMWVSLQKESTVQASLASAQHPQLCCGRQVCSQQEVRFVGQMLGEPLIRPGVTRLHRHWPLLKFCIWPVEDKCLQAALQPRLLGCFAASGLGPGWVWRTPYLPLPFGQQLCHPGWCWPWLRLLKMGLSCGTHCSIPSELPLPSDRCGHWFSL